MQTLSFQQCGIKLIFDFNLHQLLLYSLSLLLGDIQRGDLLDPVARTEGVVGGLGDSPVVFAVASHALLLVCIHVTSGHPTQCYCLLSIGHEHIGDGSTRSNFVCCPVGCSFYFSCTVCILFADESRIGNEHYLRCSQHHLAPFLRHLHFPTEYLSPVGHCQSWIMIRLPYFARAVRCHRRTLIQASSKTCETPLPSSSCKDMTP